jgi:hypothetical protein
LAKAKLFSAFSQSTTSIPIKYIWIREIIALHTYQLAAGFEVKRRCRTFHYVIFGYWRSADAPIQTMCGAHSMTTNPSNQGLAAAHKAMPEFNRPKRQVIALISTCPGSR